MDTNDKNLNTAMTLLEGILTKANFTKEEGKKYYIYFPVFDEENGKIIAEFPIFESTEDDGAKLIGWQKYNLDDYRLAEYVLDNQNITISDATLVDYKKDEDEGLLRAYIAVFLKIKEFKKAGQGIDVSAESKSVVEDLVNDFENAIVDVISEEVNSFYNYEIEYEDEEETVENTDILNDIDGLDDLDDFTMPGTTEEPVEEVEEIEEDEEFEEVEDDLNLSSLDDDFEEVEEDEVIEEETDEVEELEDDLDLSSLGDLEDLDDLGDLELDEEAEEVEELEDDLDLSSLDSDDDELMDLSSLGDLDDDDAFEAVVEKAEEELEDDLDLSSLDDEFTSDDLSLDVEKETTDLSDLGSSLDDLDDFTMPGTLEEDDEELELDDLDEDEFEEVEEIEEDEEETEEVEELDDLDDLDLDEYEDVEVEEDAEEESELHKMELDSFVEDDDEELIDFDEVEDIKPEENYDYDHLDLDLDGNGIPDKLEREEVVEGEETVVERDPSKDYFTGVIGLDSVKEKVEEFEKYLTFVSASKENGVLINHPSLNMAFVGNPGTGKTIVAEIMANKLYDLGLIEENKLVDATNYMMVEEAIEEATNGVLFITEEYMANNFCIEVLSDVLEDKSNNVVVIFAGCKKCMRRFLTPRISSKIGCTIEFPDYSAEVLSEILVQKLEKAGLVVEESAKDAIRNIMEYFSDVEKLGNAKFVSRVFEEIIVKHSKNVDADITVITEDDVPTEKEMTRSILSKKYVLKIDKTSEESLRRAAVHEVGHAVVKRLLTQKSLVKAIIVNVDYFGSLKFIDAEKHEIFAKEDYLDELKCILAGMAAEEVLLGSFGNINHRDLEQATHIARKMVTRLGMSNLGLAQIDDLECEMTPVIYEEVNKILKACYDETVELTNKNKAGIERVVEYILKNEEIDEATFIKELENKKETAKPAKVVKETKKEVKTKAEPKAKKETKAKKEVKTKKETKPAAKKVAKKAAKK